jgi:hypothetical protein
VLPYDGFHKAALGDAPEGASAVAAESNDCTPMGPGPLHFLDARLRHGWVQADTVWSKSFPGGRTAGLVCIFYPAVPGAPRSLDRARALPSGALEGPVRETIGSVLSAPEVDAPDAAAFLFPMSGVLVIARGTAIGATRALAARAQTLPPPMPLPRDVVSWVFWQRQQPRSTLFWNLRDGDRLERETYPSPTAASDAVTAQAAVVASLPPTSAPPDKTWWRGANVYRWIPKQAR